MKSTTTKTSKLKKPAMPAVAVQPSRRSRQIATDYRIRVTHGSDAAEIVEELGEFGCNLWEAAKELLGKIESKDRFDGQRFCGLVFDELVGLLYSLEDYGDYHLEDEHEKVRLRVFGKDAPEGVVEQTLWVLTDQLQQGRENKMSSKAISTIKELGEFGRAILHVAPACIDGQGGVDAEIFWRTVAHAALNLADRPFVYADESGENFAGQFAKSPHAVAKSINSTDDAVGVIEFALQTLDEALTLGEFEAA